MKLYERARQLRNSGKDYMLWGARPNEFHPNCYILDIEWSTENSSGSVMTYFYTDGSGPCLADMVANHTNKLNSTGIAW